MSLGGKERNKNMKTGDTIIISEVHNGVMIKPKVHACEMCADEDIIAFQDAESFISWIKQHFQIYEIPKWDNIEDKSNKHMHQTETQPIFS